MSARSVIRHETWTLTPDREPDAEAITYAMECVVCGKSSVVGEDFVEPQSWVLEHCGENPSHHTVWLWLKLWFSTMGPGGRAKVGRAEGARWN
ncbi:hypothetical protein [Streptomyces sp. T028]|uniref:DUF7848 domain-containing protein n=1 Tax=Streptomyces sp. T028 TaxID=3394379 RepID=UPI003A8A3308